MKNLLRVVTCAALLASLLAGVAVAGQNAGCTARIYWLSATSSTVGLATRNSTAGTGIGLVTIKNITTVRGIDVQLVINALDQTGFPTCWQAGGLGAKIGGWKAASSTIFPPLLTSTASGDGGAVPGVITIQDGSAILYHSIDHPEFTPNNCGVIWYSAGGTAGKARTAATEYAVFGFTMTPDDGSVDPASVPCHPVCIYPNWRISGHDNYNVIAIVDAVSIKDFAPFDADYKFLVYGVDGTTAGCPDVSTPAQGATWGKLKKLYR